MDLGSPGHVPTTVFINLPPHALTHTELLSPFRFFPSVLRRQLMLISRGSPPELETVSYKASFRGGAELWTLSLLSACLY
jgi:hypothetical protein